jgi:hypothetical protein
MPGASGPSIKNLGIVLFILSKAAYFAGFFGLRNRYLNSNGIVSGRGPGKLVLRRSMPGWLCSVADEADARGKSYRRARGDEIQPGNG